MDLLNVFVFELYCMIERVYVESFDSNSEDF